MAMPSEDVKSKTRSSRANARVWIQSCILPFVASLIPQLRKTGLLLDQARGSGKGFRREGGFESQVNPFLVYQIRLIL
jgi:hypothetical protein